MDDLFAILPLRFSEIIWLGDKLTATLIISTILVSGCLSNLARAKLSLRTALRALKREKKMKCFPNLGLITPIYQPFSVRGPLFSGTRRKQNQTAVLKVQ
nr:hypothetical protein Iba_chr12dCG14640 [Ipomoea batatas]